MEQINKKAQPLQFVILENIEHARACLAKPSKHYMI